MSEYVIVCVEDEPGVRDALLRDLEPFAQAFRIEAAEDVADAREVVRQCLSEHKQIALVLCDHLLPDGTGVDFLIELHQSADTIATRKVLVTGHAALADTIKAVNQADLQHFIAKPWSPEELQQAVRDQLTSYAKDHIDDLLSLMPVLDAATLLEAIRKRRCDRE